MEPPCYGRLNFLKKGAAIGSVVRASLVAYGFIEALASAVLVSGLCGSFGFAVVLWISGSNCGVLHLVERFRLLCRLVVEVAVLVSRMVACSLRCLLFWDFFPGKGLGD